MEIRQVDYFLTIVETGSFSAAAVEQNISQSSLSKRIIALEEELGVILFDRSTRKVTLTDAGLAFLDHARNLDTVYQTMLNDLNFFKSDAKTLSVATIPVLTQYGITTRIASFRDQNPDIKLSIHELDGLNILPALAKRRFDLAFVRHNYIDPVMYNCLEVCKDKLLVVVSKKHRHAGKKSLAIRDLKGDNFIVFDNVTMLHKLVRDECHKAGFEPTVFYSSHRKVSVIGLVEANIGIALIPEKVYEYHKNPEVTAIPLQEEITSNIMLVHLTDRNLPPAARQFLDFMKKSC
jgi:DNA-binding transcriptional LysR family regulator